MNFTTQNLLTDITAKLSGRESLGVLFHEHNDGDPLPSQPALYDIVELCRSLLFPGFYGKSTVNSSNLVYHTGVALEQLYALLCEQIQAGLCFSSGWSEVEAYGGTYASAQDARRRKASQLAAEFISKLPEMRQTLATDVEAAYLGDPAAETYGEVISCYPVIRAITNYRVAHELLRLNVPLIPRIITEMAHSQTGIDIHPAATIGHHFTIDHGTGVVIGATCIIGNNVKLYQGVTLGAKNFPVDEQGNPIKGIPRHPILEDDVIVYSNSTILGRITVGRGSVIGGNLWVTEDVPAGTRMLQQKPKSNPCSKQK